MRVVVLGAGVVGVAAAWQLVKDGHEVTVIDRAAGPAEFSSFANAGLVAPGHAYAWASPRAPGMMLRSLWRGDQALRFRPRLSAAQWRWVRAFLGECNDAAAARNTARKARLCAYSRDLLREVVAETGVEYDGRRGGLIYFYRTAKAMAAAAAKAEILRREGVAIETLDRAGVIARDPGLADAQDEIAGAQFAPDDESGDARLFTRALAERCAEAGAAFRWGEAVTGFRTGGGAVEAAVTTRGEVSGDAFVLCLGVFSPDLAATLGLRLPIYPVKGYSVTLPVTDPARAPRLGGVDEENLLAYCPMGARLRLTATAEIAGHSDTHRPEDFRDMLAKSRRLFGAAADFGRPRYWAGLRPMTPTGLPVIDRSRFPNLWLNTGHGHMGWTMSNGSARILADLIGQREPAIDREGMRHEG